MKRIFLIILCLLQFSCAYMLDDFVNSPGPTITYEYSRSHKVKDITVTETNWFNGNGQSHWEYKYQKGNQTICTGDCRTK